MALDRVMIDVPDTTANRERYPKATGGTRRPLPQLRAVGLSECGTHAIVDAAVGSIRTGERELAGQLQGSVSGDMLVIADRGFFSYQFWTEMLATGADLLCRAWATLTLEPIEVLDDGTWIAEITKRTVRGGKARIPLETVGDLTLATHIKVRVIEYQIAGHRGSDEESDTFRLITSILDPAEASAEELAAAYHERWEIETAFGEVESRLLARNGIRSKTPDMVEQEFWGLLLSHYAVRAFMHEAADTIDLDPDRLSFIRTLNIVRRRVTDTADLSPCSGPNDA